MKSCHTALDAGCSKSSRTLHIRTYRVADAEVSDHFVAHSWNGTFLQTRKFLSYHQNRFQDRSLIIENPAGAIQGVFPAALDPGDSRVVCSHPSSTYGGIIHGTLLSGAAIIEAFESITALYRASGAHSLLYKAVPAIHHKAPSVFDLYALIPLRAERYRCDLAAVVNLAARRSPHHRLQFAPFLIDLIGPRSQDHKSPQG